MTLRSLVIGFLKKLLSSVIVVDRLAKQPVVIAPRGTEQALKRRTQFFLGSRVPEIRNRLSVKTFFSGAPLGYVGPRRAVMRLHPAAFHLDPNENPGDGADWIGFATVCEGHVADLDSARTTFNSLLARLQSQGKSRAYVFGTGPSLAQAAHRDWSDGYRIVCNTIVRDQVLWRHLDPDVMVAGDTIYHFGFTEFASAFRKDLHARMAEKPVHFVYPASFDLVVRREFAEFSEWLVPVPVAARKQLFLGDMHSDFSLPMTGNVLNLLLLPIATTLAKEVCLWGFDGRAPADKGFWANSSAHSYSELMHTLHEAHPAFFKEHIPVGRESRYVEVFLGDLLDNNLALLEERGWVFRMLHQSFTPSLAKRHLS